MELTINERRIPVYEYDPAVHGEIKGVMPEEIAAAIGALPLEEQLAYFRVSNGRVYGERAYGEEQCNRAFSTAESLAESEYCSSVLVQEGRLIGIMWEESKHERHVLYPYRPVCVYYAEDNNGAGYKTYEEYATLVCGEAQ